MRLICFGEVDRRTGSRLISLQAHQKTTDILTFHRFFSVVSTSNQSAGRVSSLACRSRQLVILGEPIISAKHVCL